MLLESEWMNAVAVAVAVAVAGLFALNCIALLTVEHSYGTLCAGADQHFFILLHVACVKQDSLRLYLLPSTWDLLCVS